MISKIKLISLLMVKSKVLNHNRFKPVQKSVIVDQHQKPPNVSS